MADSKERRSLQESWATTTRHLSAARQVLSDAGLDRSDSATVAVQEFQDSLAHNELELALDALEAAAVGEEPPSDFWEHLLRAARTMGLVGRAARIEQELR